MASRPQLSGAVDQANKNTDLTARPRGGPVSYSDGLIREPADRLPEKGRRKLTELRQAHHNLSAIFDRAFDDWNEAREQRGRAQQRLTELTDPMAAMRAGQLETYPAHHNSVIDAQRQLDQATARFDKITLHRDATAHRRTQLNRLITRCEQYLATLPRGEVIEPFEDDPPSLRDGETVASAIERVRNERAELLADLHSVRSAPIQAAAAKAKIKREIEALAERGQPDVYHVVEGDSEEVRFPRGSQRVELDGVFAVIPSADGKSRPTAATVRGYPRVENVDTLALFAWLHRDAFIKKLNSEVDAIADDGSALSDEEREAREADLLSRVLEAERREEALVEALGDPFARRPETDPRAFLNIVGPNPNPQKVYG